MGYEIGSHLWGKGEDVPSAQDGGFGETWAGKAGSPPEEKDVPHAWYGSPVVGMVTLPEALWLSRGQTRSAIHIRGYTKARGAPWRGHVGHGSGPCGGRSSVPEDNGHRQRLRDSAVTHKVESTTKQHCRV